MQLYSLFLLASTVLSTSVGSIKSSPGPLNWHSCPQYTSIAGSDTGSSSHEDAECAVYDAVLCHPGVCDTPKGIDPTIEVFVKRLPATVGNPKTARNVWLLQGGPGISSAPFEPVMVHLHAQLNGTMNVYLMDHRGTGRSTLLDCAAIKSIPGSLWSRDVNVRDVGACAKELASKYGDLSSFSMTSAAKDVAFFIGEHTNSEDVIVYGTSYGTALAERLMHLNPPEVIGYVLDGIATSSGAKTSEFQYYSNWDTDFAEVADRFLALCEQDDEIAARFKKKGLAGTIRHLNLKLDREPPSACTTLFTNVFNTTEGSSDEPPSFALRRVLGYMLSDADLRKLIPPVVYRLNRCQYKDINILTLITLYVQSSINSGMDEGYISLLLFNLITFSEMWEMPAPSMSKMKTQFTNAVFSDTGNYNNTPLYCAYSKEKSKVCDNFIFGKYDADPLIYERDEYWNKSAVISKQASVLLLSSKLDGQTPHKYAEYLLGALDGDNKELITFEHATHGTIMTTPLVDGDVYSKKCGMELLVSYVQNGGDLKKLDKSCVGEMPKINLTIAMEYMHSYMVTSDAYDGDIDQSVVSLQSGKQ